MSVLRAIMLQTVTYNGGERENIFLRVKGPEAEEWGLRPVCLYDKLLRG